MKGHHDGEALSVLWLQSGGCGGCSMSLLCADSSDLFADLTDAGIDLLWHPAFSEQSGQQAHELLLACLNGEQRLDVLCLEGAVMCGPEGTGLFHVLAGTGRPMMEWVRELAEVARYTVAVGSCAAFGGVSAVGHQPGDVTGLQFEGELAGGLLGPAYAAGSGMPVINIAGCPTHPGWILETLSNLALGEMGEASLDALHRPRFYADHLVHHGCARNEFYEFKASAEVPGDLGCLMEHLGCKGTQAHADCNLRAWNGEGSCLRGGYPCVACTEPGFEQPAHAVWQTPKVAGIPVGLPTDMPKAWFVALAALSKSAMPRRLKENAVTDRRRLIPHVSKTDSS
ncbi:NADH-quinone oxidoreductase subunit B family protein [Halomonas faecis]|uniref:NADH-quinone oxidoreductase subunit B family protein n=1 Tax=Halomonas faecis TaxID=1562110 RepID=UPI0013D88AB3|nr:HupU protein [Halomonas faecis]